VSPVGLTLPKGVVGHSFGGMASGSLFDAAPSRNRPEVAAICMVLVAVIGLVDYVTGYTIFFEAFYLLPVGLASWYVGGLWGLAISVMSVGVWLAGDFAAGVKYSSLLVPSWNGAIALTVYLVVVKTLVSLRKLQKELEERVRQRTSALTSEIQERTRLEKELVEIGEQAQRQIGHDLHDVLGQHLTATAFAGQVLTAQLEKRALPEAGSSRNLVKLVEESISLTREFARGLQPVELNPDGLMDGFQELARKTSERFKISCEFECREPVLLNDAERGTQLYRIAQEAVTNSIKHGRAKFININLEQGEDATTLTVTDDGTGLPEKASPGEGMGLRIMAYRASMIGAMFIIERLPESGTRVTCRLPLEKSASKGHGPEN
jgi:signal transduction histidine kinase